MSLLPFTNVGERFPGIVRAALEIAYDNGGINRTRTEGDVKRDLGEYLTQNQPKHAGLQSVAYSRMIEIDLWLRGQPDEILNTICAGEESDRQAVLTGAPQGTDDLLNAIFDNVC